MTSLLLQVIFCIFTVGSGVHKYLPARLQVRNGTEGASCVCVHVAHVQSCRFKLLRVLACFHVPACGLPPAFSNRSKYADDNRSRVANDAIHKTGTAPRSMWKSMDAKLKDKDHGAGDQAAASPPSK